LSNGDVEKGADGRAGRVEVSLVFSDFAMGSLSVRVVASGREDSFYPLEEEGLGVCLSGRGSSGLDSVLWPLPNEGVLGTGFVGASRWRCWLLILLFSCY
jgi:hypothetical protein